MKRSFGDPLSGNPPQTRNGERRLQLKELFGDKPAGPVTLHDKITAEAKRIQDDAAKERAEKTLRLRAAREARDRG